MTTTDRIHAALVVLCFRASVATDDASESAARAIAAVVQRELRGPLCEMHCPVTSWLQREAKVSHAYVHTEKVIVPLPPWQRVTGTVAECVALPAPVAGAIRLYDTHLWVLKEAS